MDTDILDFSFFFFNCEKEKTGKEKIRPKNGAGANNELEGDDEWDLTEESN